VPDVGGVGGVHIGLLVVVLIGLAAPAATAPVLRARLASRYTETLTADLQARGELAAYTEIQREFSLARPATLVPLGALVIQIDAVSAPADGSTDATSVELDLAQRIGELQAAALALSAPPVAQAEAAVTEQGGFSRPATSPAESQERLDELGTAEDDDDTTERQVDQAAELAATAVAKALHLPGLGATEVSEVIREYLSGLIEYSPLKDVFAGWAAAVGLANQVRYLEEGGGPCAGCAQPAQPSDQQGPDDHPDEPDVGF
jgi:hypothetical protein